MGYSVLFSSDGSDGGLRDYLMRRYANCILHPTPKDSDEEQRRKKFSKNSFLPRLFHLRTLWEDLDAMTHIASGTTDSPPMACICIPANWKMPTLLNRYTEHENTGDQCVGRCVSGRHRLRRSFGESIPYFDFSMFCFDESDHDEDT